MSSRALRNRSSDDISRFCTDLDAALVLFAILVARLRARTDSSKICILYLKIGTFSSGMLRNDANSQSAAFSKRSFKKQFRFDALT